MTYLNEQFSISHRLITCYGQSELSARVFIGFPIAQKETPLSGRRASDAITGGVRT